MSSEKIIVLYERLSREDENLGESYSISNQKKLLEDYCREKGWTRFRHFTDDGISGTTFERPSFKAMMELVEDGEVETIILKDMSRLPSRLSAGCLFRCQPRCRFYILKTLIFTIFLRGYI